MNINAEPRSQEENVSDEEWQKVAKMAREFRAEQTAKAPERATNMYKEALDIEKDFDRRRKTIESEGGKMSAKEFEKWEDALSDEIHYADEELRRHTDYSVETIADCEQHMIFSNVDKDLANTIEAQAGNHYHDRMDALRKAIIASDDEKAGEDLEYARGFYSTVMTHLDFKYMTPEEVKDYGYEECERARTRAHNATIDHLNGLNGLAKKYNVRPFTPRNFWTSDIRDKNHQSIPVRRVMRCDRDTVEEYYALAFTSENQRREYQLERNLRLGI